MPEQYKQERIVRPDVQSLLQKVIVIPSMEYSRRFPAEMPCRVAITLQDGKVVAKEKKDYEGFFTRPMQWDTVRKKFNRLSAAYVADSLRGEIADAVARLESIRVADLAKLLAGVKTPEGPAKL